MLLTQISPNLALTQNQPIALSATPTLVTNNNVKINSANNGLIISKAGIYKVRLQLNASTTGTSLGAVLYANGNAVDMTAVTITVAENASEEIVIEYPVNVISAEAPSQALVQFYATTIGTVVNGYVTVERIS